MTAADAIVGAPDAVALTTALVAGDTRNPPGREEALAEPLAERLTRAGLETELHELAPGRASVVARLPARAAAGPALCLTGHLDTVGLGEEAWSVDPFGGELRDGRVYGRGTSDMKGAVAAMVIAVERVAAEGGFRRPVVLALCASEETGCQGAQQIAGRLGHVGAIVVGEPTCGAVAAGHKGVAWLTARAQGRAAHASTPELGSNAIDAMVDGVRACRKMSLVDYAHPLLGDPTVSVGTIHAGTQVNVVPDGCVAEIDVRLTPGLLPGAARDALAGVMGPDIAVDLSLSLPAVATPVDDPWLATVRVAAGDTAPVQAMSYFTDASVLAPALGNPPVAIFGPGDPRLAHRTDEFCAIDAIESATSVYRRLAAEWARG